MLRVSATPASMEAFIVVNMLEDELNYDADCIRGLPLYA